MQNFTTANKATLDTYLHTDPKKLVYYVAYDPTTVTGTPEADALAAGLTQYYREDTTYLVEIIYTGPASAVVSGDQT